MYESHLLHMYGLVPLPGYNISYGNIKYSLSD